MFHFLVTVFFFAGSAVNAMREKWDAAMYFLFAAGVLAALRSIGGGGGTVSYRSCQWFTTPPPPEPEKKTQDGQSGEKE